MNNYRDQFLKLALEARIITIAGGDVRMDKTFQGNGHALQLAAFACREAMEQTPPLHKAEVLVALEHISYTLPFVAVAAQSFRGGDAKGFVHYDTHRHYDRSWLGGKKVVVLALKEDDLLPAAVQASINHYGGQLLGTVALLSERANEEKHFDIPMVRVLCKDDVLQQALATIG